MLKVLKSPALLLVMAGNVPAPMAVYITYTYLPSVTSKIKTFLDNFAFQMAQSLGFSLAHASLLISVVGVTNTIGRICSGWVTDLPKVRWAFEQPVRSARLILDMKYFESVFFAAPW